MNDWDVAHAQTEEREGINPRPPDQAHIFACCSRSRMRASDVFEGCNDDEQGCVERARLNPGVDVTEVLRDYARYFVGPDMADGFAQGLLALERNWRGPLLTNAAVDGTLAQFREMERNATPQQKLNWRFQQALYRAWYDAYLRARLTDETARERRAMDLLATARSGSTMQTLAAAETALATDPLAPAGATLRARVFELAEALFQSAHSSACPGMRHRSRSRGESDLIDRPIMNADWPASGSPEIRALPTEAGASSPWMPSELTNPDRVVFMTT